MPSYLICAMIVIKGVIYIRKLLLIIPLLLLIFVGCATSSNIVAPSDFRFDDGFLYWTEVKGAEHYVIEINGSNKLAYNNKLDLKDYNTGNYTARIAAFSKGEISSYTEIIHFQLIQTESIEIISITDEVITWNDHLGLSYQIRVYDHALEQQIHSINISTNSYHYKGLEDGEYSITISAYLGDTLVTSKDIRILKGDYEYVHESGLILDIEIPTALYLGDTLLVEDTDYTVESFGLIIHSSLIDAIDHTSVVLKLVYDYDVYLPIELVVIPVPEIVSTSSVTYQDTNLTFTFDLKGGSFNGLGGNNIKSEDYTFESGILTISKTYIDEVIALDPNRTMLILTYVLENEPHVVIGYLFISIP